jgi:hypothetical protein
MSIPAVYSADQVLIVWGALQITGPGPDTFCKVERNEDSFKFKAGADGDGVRSRMLNHSGKITVTLLATSPTNALLQAAVLADEASPNGILLPAMVKDYGGNALWTAAAAWVTRPANGEMAAEAGTREWVFECARLEAPLPAHA